MWRTALEALQWLPVAGGTLLGNLVMASGKTISWASSTVLSASANGALKATNAAGTTGFIVDVYNSTFKQLKDISGALAGWNASHYYANNAAGFTAVGTLMRIAHWSGSDTGIEMPKATADLAAAASGYGRIYMRDNGSGKVQFVARFPSGAVQVITTEP